MLINRQIKLIIESKLLWKKIFQKDIELKIKSKEDFMNSFLIVTEKEYLNYINNYNFLKENIGKNWRIDGCIKYISISMVRVKKLKEHLNRNYNIFDMEKRIIINKKIEELLKYSENYRDEILQFK
jgi:hypothetical protein